MSTPQLGHLDRHSTTATQVYTAFHRLRTRTVFTSFIITALHSPHSILSVDPWWCLKTLSSGFM